MIAVYDYAVAMVAADLGTIYARYEESQKPKEICTPVDCSALLAELHALIISRSKKARKKQFSRRGLKMTETWALNPIDQQWYLQYNIFTNERKTFTNFPLDHEPSITDRIMARPIAESSLRDYMRKNNINESDLTKGVIPCGVLGANLN